ncbi:MAG: hypothetical protein QOI40_2474, partial [Alphaproteobacteria bacterium]|nr:hypothetical protein [Alphaproteobacteria bacterium]
RRILTASYDHTARTWKLPPRCQKLIDFVRQRLPRELSPLERSQHYLEQPTGADMPGTVERSTAAGEKCE